MIYSESIWNGYKRLDFCIEDRNAIIVIPSSPAKGNRWLLKTEYFGAFPDFELDMLKRGFYLAYISNKTRWFVEEDADSKAAFCELLIKEFGLNTRCMPVGMSCGGMHAIYFAAKYPKYIAAMYIDAPVLNLLSCPCGIGEAEDSMYEEFVADTGMTKSTLINYRNHPIDCTDQIIKAGIPVFMVCGDSDKTVPYRENGEILSKKFAAGNGNLTEVIKKGCDHHPHGLKDDTPLIEFTLANYH